MKWALALFFVSFPTFGLDSLYCTQARAFAAREPEESLVLKGAGLDNPVLPTDVRNVDALGEWQRKLDEYIALKRGTDDFQQLIRDFIVNYCNYPPNGQVEGDTKGLVRPIKSWQEFFRQEPFRYVRRTEAGWEAARIDLQTGKLGHFIEVPPELLMDGPLFDNAVATLRNQYQLNVEVRKLRDAKEVESARESYLRQALLKEAYLLWRVENPNGSTSIYRRDIRPVSPP